VDTQVKERLTGAAILVALVVLLVPELLTGPSRSAHAAGGRTGRPADRSFIIDLDESSAQRHVMPVPVASKAEAPAMPTAESSGPQVVMEKPRPQAVSQPPSAPPPSALMPNAAPAVADKPSAVKRTEPLPQRIATAELPPVTGWSIQLGSFQSRDNAQRLLRELKGKGFSAFILEGGGTSGKLYRVRVGPAADRAAAAALAAKLREAGQPGSIVPYP
jgi:DedD protein